MTSAEAYLWPVIGRDNLVVRTDATVARLRFEGRRATGVELSTGEEIDADRVVVAAGAIHTPAMLLRSDVDVPGIGRGLQDHPSVTLTLKLREGVEVNHRGLAIGSLRHVGGVQFIPMNTVGADGFAALLVALMTPRSRAGNVRLRPDDVDAEPFVDFALLDDPADLEAMVVAVRDALDLLQTAPFRAIVDEVLIDQSGTSAATLGDDRSIRAWISTSVGDYVHASSTCAMGTVVDSDGAVMGYDGLYVCDASVFPTIPDVNTHLPTTMLAERLCARWLGP